MNGKKADNQDDAGSDDFTSDIIGVEGYSFSVPPKKQFLPWHRPRKQFVRHEQWRYYIDQLIQEGQVGTETLTYFGLPGVDLLDLRYFSSTICEPRSIKLRFLGFNSAALPLSGEQAELNISLDEISKSPSVDPQSEIVGDDLRELVNESSIAWQKTFEFAPYDVVNLDLCDGFGAQAAEEDINETYYNALNKLLVVQMRRKSSWLLLLTTRVGKRHIHKDTLNRLAGLYRSNLSECALFRKASLDAFKISDAESLQEARKGSAGIQSIFLVGICKWLLGFATNQTPPSEMQVKNVLGYRVEKHAEVADMISIAIRFNPTHGPLEDPTKLTSIRPVKLDECELATKALQRVSNFLDVDEHLASEAEAKNEMIDAMCELLEGARYDIAEYRRWAAK